MGGNYEKGLYNQLQDVLLAFEKLTSEFARFKVEQQWEIARLKESHRQELRNCRLITYHFEGKTA